MSDKKSFEKEAEEKIENLNKAIENAETQEEIDALSEAKKDLEVTVELSEEAEEWIKKQDERTKVINDWKDETNYEYQKNIDIINDTIHDELKASLTDWYEEYRGDDIIDKEALKGKLEAIEFDFLMKECVELETKVVFTERAISGDKAQCIWIDYKFRMDENMVMHKRWNFDLLDIIRDSKMSWLFD